MEGLKGSDSVGELKRRLAEVAEVPAAQQRLIFCGKMLQDPQTLASYNIRPNVVVHLFARPVLPPPGATLSAGKRGV